jgi:hypothetical protein
MAKNALIRTEVSNRHSHFEEVVMRQEYSLEMAL